MDQIAEERVESPIEETAEVSQAEETVVDTATEEDKDSVVVESDLEEEPQKEAVEQEPEEEVAKEQKPEEEPKKDEEEIPFVQRPGVKERLDGIEEKYGSKAQYWDAIAQISKEDPEFRIAVLEKLEASGQVPAGTVEAEKAKTSSLQEEEDYVKKLPKEVQEDLRVARQLREQQQAVLETQLKEADEFFGNFESTRPEIASSPNPERTRNLIFNMANEIVDRDGIEFEVAMDEAYKTIIKPGENQEVTSAISKQRSNPGAVSNGAAKSTGKAVKLTQSQKRAAELMGATPEEYLKYANSSDEELFENI